ncbi:TetR/AcrR family transcriptional regulator [Eubacteriaceae bacterium ES3]|nr:TetR/AcrR family transcriptional regulator [Eubacteriaceae bacterium ES3]
MNNADLNLKQKIYETAKRLFFEEGYETGFRYIAEAAGVSQDVIIQYFKSKKNIAIEIYKEDHQILSTYLKYVIDPDQDIFLYIISFENLAMRIRKCNPLKEQFLLDTKNDEIDLEASFETTLSDRYAQLLKLMKPNDLSFEKNFRLFMTLIFSAYHSFLTELDDEFTDNHLLWYSTKLRSCFLNLGYSDEEITALVNLSNQKIDELIELYPYLMDVNEYLINKPSESV